MAKGQMKSNKEKRKPKKDKASKAAPSAALSAATPKLGRLLIRKRIPNSQ